MQCETRKWKDQFAHSGFLVVENVLDSATLSTLRERLEEIERDPEALPPRLRSQVQLEREFLSKSLNTRYNELSVDEVGNAIRNIMELPLFAPEFAELIFHEGLLDILEAVFESTEFHFHNYKCIVKAPMVSSTFCWHRDLPYLRHSSSNLVTAMLCVDPMTRKNGATVVYPGSHRIADEEVSSEDSDIPTSRLPKDIEPVTVECPAGSAVLFHVNTIHGGGPNRSDAPRRNIIGIWAGPDTYPITAARYAYGELRPRSADPAKRAQVELTFPKLFARKGQRRAPQGDSALF